MKKIDGMEIVEIGDIILNTDGSEMGIVVNEIDCHLILDNGIEIHLSDVPSVKDNEITIAFCGDAWFNFHTMMKIGNSDRLIKYINNKKLKVKNESNFKFSDRFWYNI